MTSSALATGGKKETNSMKASIYLGNGRFKVVTAKPFPSKLGGVYILPDRTKAYDPSVWKWSHDEIKDGVLHVSRG